ncbi:hypothetical protein CDAR_40451 [Caerostris darwini]|uniref:Uncharacterized protein n=1 Tax=Caerostris darwini TaxID=1538125 RepID=A0AAV4R8Y0_9ARAC|nr:hypothetical protein CDAR_40451 [Caerostris darwini]
MLIFFLIPHRNGGVRCSFAAEICESYHSFCFSAIHISIYIRAIIADAASLGRRVNYRDCVCACWRSLNEFICDAESGHRCPNPPPWGPHAFIIGLVWMDSPRLLPREREKKKAVLSLRGCKTESGERRSSPPGIACWFQKPENRLLSRHLLDSWIKEKKKKRVPSLPTGKSSIISDSGSGRL